MNVHFFDPPAAQKAGGLEAAITGLRTALENAGAAVDQSLPQTRGAADVVHFHGLWQPAHQRIASECGRRGIPYLVSPHGMLEQWAWRHKWWKKWPYFHLYEKYYLRRAACLLATAKGEAARLSRIFPNQRVEILPLGLTGDRRPDYDRARMTMRWSADETVLLFLSRIHRKKGLDLLLAALLEVDLPPRTRLVVVGGGEKHYVAQLRAFAEEHQGNLPQIDWTGEIWGDQRWDYFQGADLFCLPSHSENFGLAVLEACQVGTPVLTSAETPWATVLAASHGYICKPASHSISGALKNFFAAAKFSGHDRGALADWAWANYDWPNLAPRYLALYASCAGYRPSA